MLNLSGDAPVPGQLQEYRKRTTIRAALIAEPFQVETLEGTMTGQPGDFLAIGVHGERYPIAASVMADSYQLAED